MRVPQWARLATAAIALVLSVSCTVDVPAGGNHASVHPPGVRTAHQRPLEWHNCHGDFQCASLDVPLDWFSKRHETISLALIRKPARKPHPIGSLLLNPGGPGEPGISFLTDFLASGNVPDALRDHFDLVAWDPRGTGASAPVACLTNAELTEPEPLPYPPTAAGRAKVASKDLAQQKRCLDEDGRVIPYVGTRETVHDLDAIRAAVGDERLTYVGFSYGTAIGLQYQATFPERVRAMVLDGIDPPGADPVAASKAQVTSFEANLDTMLASCKVDPSCPFGDGNPRKALTEFLDHLASGARIPASYSLPDDRGVRHQRNGTLGYSEAVSGILAGLYSHDTWDIVLQGLAEATGKEPDGHLLLSLRDMLAGRNLDGTWNHSTEANAAIGCADQKVRATSDFGDLSLRTEWKKQFPYFGDFAVGLPGCFRWPDARYPLRPLTRADLAKAKPFILVNSRHDPATPYADAQKTLSLLPGSRLVTWGGNDHTSFAGGHPCIDDAVVPYLVDGTLPQAGTMCRATGE